MAVHIRLQRHGTTHRPFYHVVAADSRMARDGGRFLENLGYYDPKSEPSTINLKPERLQYWFGRGAQLSPTVAKLVKLQKLNLTRESTAKKK